MSKISEALNKIQKNPPSQTVFQSSPKPPSPLSRFQVVLSVERAAVLCLFFAVSVVAAYSVGLRHGTQTLKTIPVPSTVAAVAPVLPAVPAHELVEEVKAEAVASPEPVAVPPFPSETTVENVKNLFTIQLAAYRREDQAVKQAERLSQKGQQAFVLAHGRYYHVCLERFDDRGEAARRLGELQNDPYAKVFQGAFIRSLKQ